MKKEYDFPAGRIGQGYQTLINEALREHLADGEAMNAKTLRRSLREELKRAAS